MEEGSQQRGITAAFPPPPPFWRQFNPENLEKLEKAKAEANPDFQKHQWTPEALRALTLPPELRVLIPPDYPKEGSYSLFGDSLSVATKLDSLSGQGIEQLYPSTLIDEAAGPSPDHAYYLLKISKSLLLNFLELVGLLSICPEQHESKVEDIRNLFLNAHHLLNVYRPHQSRESLITMMQEQLEQAREEIREMDEMKERVRIYLSELEAEGKNISLRDKETRVPIERATTPEVAPSGPAADEDLWRLMAEI